VFGKEERIDEILRILYSSNLCVASVEETILSLDEYTHRKLEHPRIDLDDDGETRVGHPQG